jgi:hypothetical protein
MEDTKKIQYDASLDQIGLGIEYPTELDAKRRYAVGCYTPEDLLGNLLLLVSFIGVLYLHLLVGICVL